MEFPTFRKPKTNTKRRDDIKALVISTGERVEARPNFVFYESSQYFRLVNERFGCTVRRVYRTPTLVVETC